MTSPGARYSAGTAILDVVPVFGGIQNAIAREVRKMERALGKEAGKEFGKQFGDESVKAVDRALGTTKDSARKQGKEAADEYAGQFAERFHSTMQRVQREVGTFKYDVQFDDKKLQNKFNAVRRDIESLSKTKVGIDMDAGPAMIELDHLDARLRALRDAAVNLDVRTNLGTAISEVEAFRKRIQQDAEMHIDVQINERQIGLFETAVRKRIAAALQNFPPIEFDADITPAQQKLMILRQRMQELAAKRIGIDIKADKALRDMEALRRELAILATDETIDVKVRTDAAGAAAELLAIRALAEVVDKTKVEIETDVDTDNTTRKLARLRQELLGVDAQGREGANGFRAFNAMVLLGAGLLPAVVPALTAVAGGLALIGPLALGAGAGIGTMLFAFSGIGDAVGALNKVQQNAGKDAEASAKRIRSASRTVEDAERSVSRAREAAGQSATDASRRVSDAVDAQRDAEKRLTQAQEAAKRAQEAVTEARERAQDRIEDLRLSLLGGALAEREAVLDLADAQREYDASLADPGATAEDRERLSIDLEQQRLQVERLRLENGRLGEQQDEVNRTGVEGSQEVISAQDGVRSAQEGVADALAGVQDATQGVSDALVAQQQTNAEAQQSIEDAQRNLTQAQEDYNTAISEGSASTQALEVAMGKLGPAGQEFATFIAGLQPQMRGLRDLVQAGLFPGLEDAIDSILTKNGPLLATFMTNMGQTLGDLFRQFGELMTTPQWMSIWATFNEYAPRFMTQFAQVGMAMLTFFGELFQGLAPYAATFGDALVRMADAAVQWVTAFVQSDTFRDLMDWLFTNGPVVFDVIWNILKAAGNLIIALEPLGMLVLGIVGNIAEWIAAMDPTLLGIIVTSILGLVVAFQLAAGAIALASGAFAILTTPISLIVFLIGVVVTGLVVLYTHSEIFRDIVDGVFKVLGAVIGWFWNTIVEPIFGLIGLAFKALAAIFVFAWEYVLQPVFTAISTVATWLWDNILHPIFTAIVAVWNALATAFKWGWDNILEPVFSIFGHIAQVLFAIVGVAVLGPLALLWKGLTEAFKWGWENILYPLVIKPFGDAMKILYDVFIKPIVDGAVELWNWLTDQFKWGYENILKPYVIDPFAEAMNWLGGVFDDVVKWISDTWDDLQDALATPINFVIHYVLNKGLFAAWNWVVDTLGLPDDWKIADWAQLDAGTHFAAGGQVPGWSPNDKADNIPAMLTAREYVQPVDAVDYYGVNTMDLLRRKKIPKEAMDGLQYYATGGFVAAKRRPVYMQPAENVYGAEPHTILPANMASYGQLFGIIKAAFPNANLNSGYRAGSPDYHGQGKAVDLGEAGFAGGNGRPYLAAMNRWIYDNYGGSTELIYDGAGDDRPDLWHGKNHAYDAFTTAQHHNHVHWAVEGPIEGAAVAGLSGSASAGVDQPWWLDLWHAAGDVLTWLKDKVAEPVLNFVTTFGESTVGKIITGLPLKLVDGIWGIAKDLIASVFLGGQDIEAGDTSGTKQAVQNIAQNWGWQSGAEWDAIDWIVNKESGWNPRAQNPKSTASGLFQQIDGTWRANRPIGVTAAHMKDARVVEQGQAGLKYIKDRYGSPTKAQAFWRSHNYYGEGGEVTPEGSSADTGASAPTLYDTGGWLPPGITTVLNATNKPEPVLTGDQWRDLISSRPNSDGGDINITVPMMPTDSTPAEVADAVLFAGRVIRRGGKYAGSTP